MVLFSTLFRPASHANGSRSDISIPPALTHTLMDVVPFGLFLGSLPG